MYLEPNMTILIIHIHTTERVEMAKSRNIRKNEDQKGEILQEQVR